jgi:hypothetical protein
MQVPATGLENPGERPFVAWGPAEFDLDTVFPSSRIVNLPPQLIQAMFPQLHIGETARVVVGQGANNLRATPNGELVGQIPEGGQVLVIEGPVWAEEMPWWRVNYNGQEGWTAEYGNGTHWLELVVD